MATITDPAAFEAATDGAATQGADSTVTYCEICEGNWINIRYEYEDGTGIAGANYVVQTPSADGTASGTILAEGTTDENGEAHVVLPEEHTDVEFYFHDDPDVEPYEDPEAEVPLQEPEPGFWAGLWSSISTAADWVWGVLKGDFDEDPSTSQIIARMILTMIPGIDQLADVQDVVSVLYRLIWKKEYDNPMHWVTLVITLIGLVPTLGSLAKGLLKLVIRRVGDLTGLYRVFNYFSRGNAHRWIRDLANDLVGRHLDDALALLDEMMARVITHMTAAKGWLSWTWNSIIDDALLKIADFRRIAPQKMREAAADLQGRLLRTLAVGMSRLQRKRTKNIEPHTVRQGSEPPPTRVTPNSQRIDELVDGGTVQNADVVNASDRYPEGYEPPYTPGTDVTDFTTDGSADFVRVHGPDNTRGSWIMRESDIAGLTPEQIADRYALPAVPTHVIGITPPAGTLMRTGSVNPNFGGAGGAQQFEMLERVNDGWGTSSPLN